MEVGGHRRAPWPGSASSCALRRAGRGQAVVLTVLAVAGMLAPLEQARIHTITSLHKHVDFGAWLAAPAAGYALAQLSRIGRRRSLNLAVAGLMIAAIVPVGTLGSAAGEGFVPGMARFLSGHRPAPRPHPVIPGQLPGRGL